MQYNKRYTALVGDLGNLVESTGNKGFVMDLRIVCGDYGEYYEIIKY